MSNRTAPHDADQRADGRPADVRRLAGADTALPRGKSQLIIDAHDRVQGMNSVVETVSMLGLRERRRLERDLHDGAQQRLVSLALTLRMAREKLGPDAGEAGRLLDRSRQELDEALQEIRELVSRV
jgi:signal transduction histidine kinase